MAACWLVRPRLMVSFDRVELDVVTQLRCHFVASTVQVSLLFSALTTSSFAVCRCARGRTSQPQLVVHVAQVPAAVARLTVNLWMSLVESPAKKPLVAGQGGVDLAIPAGGHRVRPPAASSLATCMHVRVPVR